MSDKQHTLPIIFVLGAGKSYLCRRAAAEDDAIEHIVMSSLLKAEAERSDSPWAQEINDKLPSGTLVSSELSTAILQGWFDRMPKDQTCTYLLDGFPRNIGQANKFVEKVWQSSLVPSCVIDLLAQANIQD
ncbi:MAG: hypothetical protein Q9166_006955 [cf. Caloplaca sp. 2 TL-2023]